MVLALDFGGTKVDVATATSDGRILAAERISTDASLGAEQVVERAIAAARGLVDGDAACVAVEDHLRCSRQCSGSRLVWAIAMIRISVSVTS